MNAKKRYSLGIFPIFLHCPVYKNDNSLKSEMNDNRCAKNVRGLSKKHVGIRCTFEGLCNGGRVLQNIFPHEDLD